LSSQQATFNIQVLKSEMRGGANLDAGFW